MKNGSWFFHLTVKTPFGNFIFKSVKVYKSRHVFFSYFTVFLFDTLFLPSAQTVETVKGSMAALWFTYFHIFLQTPSHDVHRVTLPDQEQTQCLWMRWFPGTVLQCWESYDLLRCCLAQLTRYTHWCYLGRHLLDRSFKYRFAVLN